MKRTDWPVGPESIRPAGRPGQCFYCHAPLGGQHEPDCVMRQRTVNVEFTMRLVVPVPEDWSEGDIEFQFNESSWCASNVMDILEKNISLGEDGGEYRCLCDRLRARYLGEATEQDEEKSGVKVEEIES